MGEPFVDGPICPSVRQMFSKELFGALEKTGDVHAGYGISKLGSHFREGFFGARTRRRDLVKVFWWIPRRTFNSSVFGTSVLGGELLGVFRMVFRDREVDSSPPKESTASGLKSRGDALRSLDAVGRSRGVGRDYGQRELVILSKRAKGMRGCQVASRDTAVRVSKTAKNMRHDYKMYLVAKFMAGVLNQCSTRHPV